MKKQITLAAGVLFFAVAVHAQAPATFGVRAGVISAGMRGDAVSNLNSLLDFTNGMLTTGNRTGLYAGVYTTLPLGEKISIEPGITYIQKGFALKGNLAMKALSVVGVHAGSKLSMNYIDVPVLIKGTFNGLQVFAGPQVSYLTGATLNSKAGVLGINLLNNSTNATAQFNRWDAGVTGGVGYEFSNGFSVSAAYDQGLAKVDANKSLSSYNHAVKLGIGMRF